MTPELGTLIKADGRVRMTVIHVNAVLYYCYYREEELIELVQFRDTRQNPASRKF